MSRHGPGQGAGEEAVGTLVEDHRPLDVLVQQVIRLVLVRRQLLLWKQGLLRWLLWMLNLLVLKLSFPCALAS